MPIKITREEYKEKFGVEPPVSSKQSQSKTPEDTKMPLLTNEKGGFGTALKDVTVGAGKSFLRGARGLVGMVQGIGQKVLGTKVGIESIDDKTATGKRVSEQLENKSKGEQVGGVLGTIAEVATGFVAAKGPQALNKARQAYKASKDVKSTNKALEQLTPDLASMSKTELRDNLMKGKVTPETVGSPSKYILSEPEKQIALKNKYLIDKKSVINTANNITKEIGVKDAEVGKFLTKNNGIFNGGELKNHILNFMKDVDDIAIDPGRVTALKDSMVNNFIKALKKNDMKSLWEARKAFDSSLDKIFSGSPTLQKTVKRQFRNAIQDFIASKTPNGIYKSKMKEMSELFDLFDVVAEKAVNQKGRSKIGQWIKNNPKKAKLIGYGIPGFIGADLFFGN